MSFRVVNLPYPTLAAGGRRLIADPKKVQANVQEIARALAGNCDVRSIKGTVKLTDAQFREAYTLLPITARLGPNLGALAADVVKYYYDNAQLGTGYILYASLQRQVASASAHATYGGGWRLEDDLALTVELRVTFNGRRIATAKLNASDPNRHLLWTQAFSNAQLAAANFLEFATNANAGTDRFWVFDAVLAIPWKATPAFSSTP